MHRINAMAIERGVDSTEYKGRMKKYFDYLNAMNEAAMIKIWANFIWIFKDNKLVTIFQVPKNIKYQ